jgi:hypothetical protein
VFHTHKLLSRTLLAWPFTRPFAPNSSLPCGFLDVVGLPCAEAWRLLRPVAARLDTPRPSYSSVRRILIAERERKRRNKEDWDRFLGDMLAGRVPYVSVEHKLIGVR